MKIEFVSLQTLRTWPRNPKNHDTPEIIESFGRFGFVNPIIIDETTGRIVAGHGRLEAASKMQLAGQAPPERVQVGPAGDWKLPVLRGVAFKNEIEAQAYLLADNFLGEKGGWNNTELIAALQTISPGGFRGTGYSPKELERLIAKYAGDVPLPNEDDPAVKPKKPRSRKGQVYQLGPHRILCGDSTHAADVSKLLSGASPSLMVTDPPYGVEYDPEWRIRAGVTKAKSQKMAKVANDHRADWTEAWELFRGAIAYVWHGGLHAAEVQQSLERAGFEIRSQIVWVKDRFALSRGHYHWQHEPCWMAVRKHAQANWNGARNQSTTWGKQGETFSDRLQAAALAEDWPEIARIAQDINEALQTTVWAIPAREDAGHGHGTQKPVECMRRPMVNHTVPGDAIYDPFLGSGSTLIAAESTGRVCYGMDIAPECIRHDDRAIRSADRQKGDKGMRGRRAAKRTTRRLLRQQQETGVADFRANYLVPAIANLAKEIDASALASYGKDFGPKGISPRKAEPPEPTETQTAEATTSRLLDPNWPGFTFDSGETYTVLLSGPDITIEIRNQADAAKWMPAILAEKQRCLIWKDVGLGWLELHYEESDYYWRRDSDDKGKSA